MKNVLVVGASGFLGSQIVKLLSPKKYRVFALDISKPTKLAKDVTYFQKSIKDFFIEKTYLSLKIDIIVNTAASLPYKGKDQDFYTNNVQAATLICQLYEVLNYPKILHVSSSGVYGLPNDIPINSKTKFNPMDAYAKSKIEAENILKVRVPKKNLTIIRPKTIVGPGRTGIFDILLLLIRYKVPIPLPQGGSQILQFVHVTDLSRLIVYLMENSISGVWGAGGPNPKPLKYELTRLSKSIGVNATFVPINKSLFVWLGKVLIFLKVIKFTKWHFVGFTNSAYYDPNWTPDGFKYYFESGEALSQLAEGFNGEFF